MTVEGWGWGGGARGLHQTLDSLAHSVCDRTVSYLVISTVDNIARLQQRNIYFSNRGWKLRLSDIKSLCTWAVSVSMSVVRV